LTPSSLGKLDEKCFHTAIGYVKKKLALKDEKV
jgi:hypothetical protein